MFKAREIDCEVLFFCANEFKKKDDSSRSGEAISNVKKTDEPLALIGKK